MDDLFSDFQEGQRGVDDDVNYGDILLEEEKEINQEEVWVVIDEYFRKKGLVGQQLDSFDEFIRTTIQELIDDLGEIIVIPQNQYIPGVDVDQVRKQSSSCICIYVSFSLSSKYLSFYY